MISALLYFRFHLISCLLLLTVFCGSCKDERNASSAFYYWKRNFQLDKAQSELLTKVAQQKLYLRFFDIKWDTKANKPYPEAIVNFKGSRGQTKEDLGQTKESITPVIFITNQTFEKLDQTGIDSLAIKANELINHLAIEQKITYQSIQIDCDWTIGTKDHYFKFLKIFKRISNKKLEATIRLHQVKYQFKTGVPPVDRGVLMFYNMGRLSPNLKEPNSIYNSASAAAYTNSLPKYLLPLDIALPVFSWSLQIRSGKIIQVYGKIGRKELNSEQNFSPTLQKNVYRATKSFFTDGVYVKTGDLFKLEEIDKELLKQAALQLSVHLNKKEKRTIIYYELSNLDLSAFKAKDFKEISSYF